jgi:hypothetical protein
MRANAATVLYKPGRQVRLGLVAECPRGGGVGLKGGLAKVLVVRF